MLKVHFCSTNWIIFLNQTEVEGRSSSFDDFFTLNSLISKNKQKKEICHEKQNLLQKAERKKTDVQILSIFTLYSDGCFVSFRGNIEMSNAQFK